jgi:hypothetical protein
MVHIDRVGFNDSLTMRDILSLVSNPKIKFLQCMGPISDSVWALLNDQFFAMRPDVELRVFWHPPTGTDLGFASKMTNVRRFTVDSLRGAKNVEAIADMPQLESLSLGYFEPKDFILLDLAPSTLTKLSVKTRDRKSSLASLRRFRSLKILYLEGQCKDIEVLGELHDLEDLTLRSITTPDLSYLAHLKKLWSLDIKLGGIRSFVGIEGKESIKYLELWQVRELKSIEIIAALPGLQNLFLQSLPHIESLPSLTNASALRRVYLENMKGMRDFSSLEYAPILEEFCLINGDKQTPEQLLPVLRNAAVRMAFAGLGNYRKNEAFARLRDSHGKLELTQWTPFVYR